MPKFDVTLTQKVEGYAKWTETKYLTIEAGSVEEAREKAQKEIERIDREGDDESWDVDDLEDGEGHKWHGIEIAAVRPAREWPKKES